MHISFSFATHLLWVMSLSIISVLYYIIICAILYYLQLFMILPKEEDRKLLVGFLEDVMTTLSLSHAPLNSLKASFVELG